MRIRMLLALSFLFSCTLAASATPIIYTETFLGSGNLVPTGSKVKTSFTNELITLTFTGNTANVGVTPEGPYDVSLITGTGDTTVSVAGLGSYTVSDSMEVYDYGAYDTVPFIDFGINNYTDGTGSLATILYSDSFACDSSVSSCCYTLETALGPVSALSSGRGTTSSASGYLDTSAGKLTVTKGSTFTFTASNPPPAVTPEPSSLVLLGTGIVGMAGMARRKFRLA